MRNILLVFLVVLIVPVIISCAAPKEAVRGTGEGTMNVIEGAGKGVIGLSKGTGTFVKESADTTGEFITGRGKEASESGKAAIVAGGEGIKDIVVEPVEGIGKGLQSIDKGIKKATKREEDVK